MYLYMTMYLVTNLYLQSYNLRDVNAVRSAVKYSNVVINLIGRDYETRYIKFVLNFFLLTE